MTIPTNIVSDLLTSTKELFSGSLPIVLVFFGIVVGSFLVKTFIGLLPKTR